MVIIKPKFSGNQQVNKLHNKANHQRHGSHGGKGGRKGAPQGKGGGKGAQQGAGQWMFVPAAQVGSHFRGAPQRAFGTQKFGGQKFGGQQFGGQKFGGQKFGRQQFGGAVKAFGQRFASGKGGGKHASQDPKQKETLDKLGKVEVERKVWVGGLPKEVSRGKLFAHFKDTVKPQLFTLMSKGTACMAFKNAEDAQLAIDTFNGSDLEGKDIQVDVWTQKEKKERPEGDKPRKNKSVVKTSFLKGKNDKKQNKPVDSKMKLKIKSVDHTLKVWVGGLSENTTWKQLKEHFVASGCEVDMCDLMKKGTACCTFKTDDEASSAIGVVNGTELNDKTIEVDAWTRPERKEKKQKEAKE